MKKLKISGLTLLFLATAGFTASSWNPVLKISTDPGDGWFSDKYPQIAVSTSSISSIVWERSLAHQWTICWVRVSPSGIVGTLQIISTHPIDGSWDHPSPQVAIDSQGNSGVVWSGYDGHDWEVYWVKIDSAGVPGIVQKISTHPDNVNNDDWISQIAVDFAGNSYVVWWGSDGHDYEVYWVKIDSSGIPGPVQKISTHPDNVDRDAYLPQIAADSAGDTSVVWEGYNGHHNYIYWVKIDSSGIPGPVQKISTHPDNVTWGNHHPQIALDHKGNCYITWDGYDGDFGRTYLVSNNVYPLIPAITDNLTTPNQQMQPLAQYRILKAEALQNQIQTVLSALSGADTSDCQKLIEEGDQFLALAKNSFAGGNYIAANIFALNALRAYQEVIAFLESVTG